MRELHVVAVSEDGRHVVLASRKGAAGKAEFHVLMDDRLTSAIRGDLPRLGERSAPESAVTPKEIQARLRAGESVEQIAVSAGVPAARVERFAGPVFSERERVIAGARAAILTRPRRGLSALPLGDAVAEHLQEMVGHKADSTVWSARREDSGRWLVQVHFLARAKKRSAGWRYDPATREVVAVDGWSAAMAHVDVPAARRAGRTLRKGDAVQVPGRSIGAAPPSASGRSAGLPAAAPAADRAATGRPAPGAAPPAEGRSAAAPTAAARPARPAPAGPPDATAPAARRPVAATTGSTRKVAAPKAPGAGRPARAAKAGAAPAAPSTSAGAATTRVRTATVKATGVKATGVKAAGVKAPTVKAVAVSSSEPVAAKASRTTAAPAKAARTTAAPKKAARTKAVETGATTKAGESRVAGPVPSGPPTLRVVPPPGPEPLDGGGTPQADAPGGTPAGGDEREPAAARPTPRPVDEPVAVPAAASRPVARRAAGGRASVPVWADVLLGTAPVRPAAAPDRED